ncbi:MAG: DUF1217 domain-containing protein [Pseudomonadota bacterium]
MWSTIEAYRLISNDLTAALDRKAQEPDIEREIAYYRENIADIDTIDDFMENDRIYQFAMRAYGLEEMIYAKGFIRKLLEEGVNDSSSLANQLVDSRYKEFAEVFNFEGLGTTATIFDRAQEGTVDLYVRQRLETDAGADNEGVRLALYFQRQAPDITTGYGLLADPAVLKVAQTLANLPESSSSVDIDRQAEILEERIDIEDFQDPVKLEELMQRFTVLWEMNNGSTSSTSTPNVLIAGSAFGISESLLSQIQNFKKG